MKLHLGCGQIYLEGYVNIDFPSESHTVQTTSVADEIADILKLQYKAESIEEVRLHHVFEHFLRPVACALLASWNSWLKTGGTLRVEVPDFNRTAWNVLNPLSNQRQKSVALRHIFGSNEEFWAVHYEGWSAELLRRLFEDFGFTVDKINKASYKGTYNVEVFAHKIRGYTKAEFASLAKKHLSDYLLDDSESETTLLEVWMNQYRGQIKQTLAK